MIKVSFSIANREVERKSLMDREMMMISNFIVISEVRESMGEDDAMFCQNAKHDANSLIYSHD